MGGRADKRKGGREVAIVEPVNWSLRAARLRWAELLRRIFEVDPLACPRCGGLLRIVAVITVAAGSPGSSRIGLGFGTHPSVCPEVPEAVTRCPATAGSARVRPRRPEPCHLPRRGTHVDAPEPTGTFRGGEANPYPLLYGTDASAGAHGRNAEDLICRVREAGQPPMEALVTATSRNAAGLGLGDRIETVAPGYQADLIALEGNPPEEIEAVRRVRLVMKAGKVFVGAL